jgi:hypothetical protein
MSRLASSKTTQIWAERIAQCERPNACRCAGFWPCAQLAHMRLTWVRLRRSAPGSSRCGMRWFLSKKVGGLITAMCGLGGPHYGEEQSAKQPYARTGYLIPPGQSTGGEGGPSGCGGRREV